MVIRQDIFCLQYKEDEDESGLNLDELSDDDDEISLSSNLSAEAAGNVKAISVENAFIEVTITQVLSCQF